MAEEEGPDQEEPTQLENLWVTRQELELFQQEGLMILTTYDITIDGEDRNVMALHLYPWFLGMKETIQDLYDKNHALFQMINQLNSSLMQANALIATLKQDVEELKKKRIIH